MSVNDFPRDTFGEMEKRAPPAYSASCSNNGEHSGQAFSQSVMTADLVQEQIPPPAYDDIFSGTQIPAPRSSPKGLQTYYKDDRNTWEKLHEWFEMSVLQQIIWCAVLAFSISYIYYGTKYSGECIKKRFDKKGNVTNEDDLTAFIKAEGGVICATILYAFLIRLLVLSDLRRTHQKPKSDLEGQKKCGGNLFFLGLALYIAIFGLCIAGATKIIPLYNPETNTTVTCAPAFYDFYYHAKIGQLAVFMPYAFYIIFCFVFMIGISKEWFIRRKLRRWAKLLDADQDGVISQDDMRKTNEKLEMLRKVIGARTTALSSTDQKKWWDDNIFKRGPGKDIEVEDYINVVEGTLGTGPPHDRAGKIRPVIKSWFEFFTTEEYLKRKLLLGGGDFVKFWAILDGNSDEQFYKKMYIKHFPAPFSMSDFLEDFVAFLSNPDFFDEFSSRVYHVVKYQSEGICCKV